jgi:asparagine synthase (glutamine-hydrolysing)
MHLRLDTPDHRAGHKALLRQAFRGILPDQVLNRPKSGFQPPVQEWLSAVVNKYGAMLEGGELINAGIIDKTKCKQVMNQFATGNIQELFFIYKVVLLEMWYQTVVAPVRYVH